MIYKVIECTDTEVIRVEEIEAVDSYILCENISYKQNPYGLFPFKLDGGVVRYKTEAELEAEHAEELRNDLEPTQLDTIEAQVMYTALMTDTLIEEV